LLPPNDSDDFQNITKGGVARIASDMVKNSTFIHPFTPLTLSYVSHGMGMDRALKDGHHHPYA